MEPKYKRSKGSNKEIISSLKNTQKFQEEI